MIWNRAGWHRYRRAGVLVALVALVVSAGCKQEEAKREPQPAEVTAITVTPRTVPVESAFVAQVESSHQVEIVTRVNGFLDKILYHEGEVVQAGETMFLLDQKPFLAQLEAAKGALANQEAQLWTAQANLKRVEPLVKLNAASKSDYDYAVGTVKSAEAAVHQAKAQLSQAELDLSYTVIKSPVTGVTGEALVREGAYLSVGAGGSLSYVARLDPVWVTFSVSQNQLARSQDAVEKGVYRIPEDRHYSVEIILDGDKVYPHAGRVNFVAPSFSAKTGTFMIKAELPNSEGILRPGMFVKAVLKGATRPDAIVIPQRAVQQTTNGHVVFVVSSSGTGEVRPVMVGPWLGQDWIIENGLSSGEQVIVDGFMRLAPGMPVKVTPLAESRQAKDTGSAASSGSTN